MEDRSKWWVGFSNHDGAPPEGYYFVIAKCGIAIAEAKRGPYTGYAGSNYEYDNDWGKTVWDYHSNNGGWRQLVRSHCDRLGIPYLWNDSILLHPCVQVLDENGDEICRTVRKIKREMLLKES